MLVEAVEMGERPAVLTKARRFAPEGVRILAELLETQSFADMGLLILDWDDSLHVQPEGAAYPVIHVRVLKRVTEFVTNNLLTVDLRLNVEEMFGSDEATADDMIETVKALEDKVAEQIALRRQS